MTETALYLERLRAMHQDGGRNSDRNGFEAASDAFAAAASDHLKAIRGKRGEMLTC